jgi:hypothetical protein
MNNDIPLSDKLQAAKEYLATCPPPVRIRPVNDLKSPDESCESIFEFTTRYQQEILSMLIHDCEFTRQAINLIKPRFFQDHAHELLCRLVFNYFQAYGKLPPKLTLDNDLLELRGNDPRLYHYQGELEAVWEGYVAGLESREACIAKIKTFAKEQLVRTSISKTLDDLPKITNHAQYFRDIANTFDSLADAYQPYSESFPRLADLWGLPCQDKWLIEGKLLEGRLTLMAGASKKGKTVALVQSLASMIMEGQAMGAVANKNAPVLWLDYEMHWHDLRRYLSWYIKDASPHRLFSQFTYNCRSTLIEGKKPLPPALTVEYLQSVTKGQPTGLIVVDPFRGAYGQTAGLAPNWENDATTIGKLLRPLADWCHDSGWAVVMIHHANKMGGTSGSTEFHAAVDCVWEFARIPEPSNFGKDSNMAEISIVGRMQQQEPIVLTFENNIYQFAGSLKDAKNQNKNKDEKEIEYSLTRLLKQGCKLAGDDLFNKVLESMPDDIKLPSRRQVSLTVKKLKDTGKIRYDESRKSYDLT